MAKIKHAKVFQQGANSVRKLFSSKTSRNFEHCTVLKLNVRAALPSNYTPLKFFATLPGGKNKTSENLKRENFPIYSIFPLNSINVPQNLKIILHKLEIVNLFVNYTATSCILEITQEPALVISTRLSSVYNK